MRNDPGRVYTLAAYAVATLLSGCGSEPSSPPPDAGAGNAAYAGGVGGGGAGGSGAGSGGAGGAGAAISAKARCGRADGWPTLSSVLGKAELLPDTGDVEEMVMTSRGLHWLGYGSSIGALYRLGSDGKPVQLATTEDGKFPQLVASDNAIAWLWDNSVWALSLDPGATPIEIGTGINLTGSELMMDNTHVYFEPAFTTPGLTKIPLTGGPPTKVPTSARDVIGVHDGYAYYGETDSISGDNLKRAPLAGGAAEQVAEGVGFLYTPPVLFDGNVMYLATRSFYRIELDKPNSKTLVFVLASAPRQGTNNYLTSMVLDDDRVVYADDNGTVGWYALDGSECANIIADPDRGTQTAEPVEITLDATHLYLLVYGENHKGSLYRIERSDVGL